MSGIIKGVTKVFKKVVKTVIKIAPYIIIAAAIIYTGGAALGVAGAAGGWSAAAASLVGSVGATGALAGVMTGALTYAGYGAITGAVIAAAKGNSISQGIKTGALTGAVSGGVLGYINPAIAQNTIAANQAAAATTTTPAISSVSGEITGAAPTSAITQPITATPTLGLGNAGAGATAAKTAALAPEVLAAKEAGKFAIAGNVIQGLGAGFSASGAADAERELREERRANFLDDDSGFVGLGQGTSNVGRPQQTKGTSARFEWDPVARKIVFVPATTG